MALFFFFFFFFFPLFRFYGDVGNHSFVSGEEVNYYNTFAFIVWVGVSVLIGKVVSSQYVPSGAKFNIVIFLAVWFFGTLRNKGRHRQCVIT